MPESRLVIFDDAGHFPHHNDRDRFVSELNGFIETTAPSQHEPERWRALLRDGAPQADTVSIGVPGPIGANGPIDIRGSEESMAESLLDIASGT